MKNLIERFTLECRTNKSGKLNLSNRAKRVIRDVVDELSVSKNIELLISKNKRRILKKALH